MSINTAEKGVILIVDDNKAHIELLLNVLENAGFTVLMANNGERAVEIAEYALPNVILLDVLMPKMDGFETCRRLKINALTQDIPVIFLTAAAKKGDKVKGLSVGAVDYITIPIESEEVLARVNIHLRLRNLTKSLKEQNEHLEKEISKRKRLEQECKQAEQKIREQAELLDITTDAIIVRQLDHQIRFWNQGAERLYGWKAQQVLNKNVNELLYQHESLSQLDNIQTSLAESGSWQGELHQLTKQGKEIIVASRWTLVRDEDGQPKSILTVNTDITDKKTT